MTPNADPDPGRQQVHRRFHLQWQDRALLILALVLITLFSVRAAMAQADESFWGLEFNDGSRSTALDTNVHVEISGLAARVRVIQSFENLGSEWLEARYRYPLPPGAAVDRLIIESDGRIIEGEIQEKAEARRRYQQARASGAVASLVEQQRRNQFQTSIANIAPGAVLQVSISFIAHVDYQDEEFRLDLPLTFTPRADSPSMELDSEWAPQPVLVSLGDESIDDHYFTLDIELNAGVPLAHIESPWHDVDIHPTMGGYRIFLSDPDERTDRDFALVWTPDFGTVPQASLSSWDSGEASYALLMLAPPLAEALNPLPREVVFVIDTSGSMQGTSLDQAKQALLQGLEFLGPDDRFNLVRFSSESERLFEESVPASTRYLQESKRFIEALQADGGTVMAPALTMAMSLPEHERLLRQIVFVTDGSAGNERELLLQIGEQLGDNRLFTVSIGSAPNTWFMRKAAEIGRGTHTRIGSSLEVAEQMDRLWSRIQNPAIQNLCVDWGMDAEFYPEIIPDLYAGEPLWLNARLPQAPGSVTLCGELDGQFWQTKIHFDEAAKASGSENLATLWARSKVESLEDSRIFGTPPGEIRKAVVEVALDYGLLTAYTSLVAVDRTPVRPVDASLKSEEVPGLLPAGAASTTGFSQTGNGWLIRAFLCFLSLLTATAMLLYLPPSRARSQHSGRQPVV